MQGNPSFIQTAKTLQNFLQKTGCATLSPYPATIGAGTFHPTFISRCGSNEELKLQYLQPCTRPSDNRYGRHPSKLYQHHQYQVILKPIPDHPQDLYLQSLRELGITTEENDIKFIEDNWENPSIGAYGLGWEVQINGMEVTQFTYMQQIGAIGCNPTLLEITYGLERIAMILQNVDSVYELQWDEKTTYGDLFFKREEQFSEYIDTQLETQVLHDRLLSILKEVEKAILTPFVAYDLLLHANHLMNLLIAKRAVGHHERTALTLEIRLLTKRICEQWFNT